MTVGVKGFQKGRVVADETRRRISEAKTKRVYFHCEYCGVLSQDTPKHHQLSKRHFCSRDCYSKFRKDLPKEEQNRFGTGKDDEQIKTMKIKARSKLNHAIRDGLITRKSCEICDSKESEGHHEDYAKPLEVRWLCFTHHRLAHDTPNLLEDTKHG